MKEITSSSSSVDPIVGFRVQVSWGGLFIGKFPPAGAVSCFLSKLLITCSSFLSTFQEKSWRASGCLVKLIPPYWVNPWSKVHAHFSTSFMSFSCEVLCLSPGARRRIFVPEKCCSTSAWFLFQTHPVLSHSVFLPPTSGYVAISVRHIQYSAFSSGLLQ